MKFPVLIAAAAIPAAVLLVEAAAWFWMHPHREGDPVVMPAYRFPPEGEAARLDPEGITKVKEALGCDDGLQGMIRGQDGSLLSVAFFEWNKSQSARMSEVLAHMPEVCMGAGGADLEERYPSRRVPYGDFDLIFDSTRFRGENGRPTFIFKAPWIEGFRDMDLRQGPYGHTWQEDKRRFRLLAVKNRFKPRYARVLMASVRGVETEEAAWEAFRREILENVSSTMR